MAEDVVIVGGARTPFCEWQGGKRGDGQPGGLLKDVSALKLGEIAIKGALDKTGTSPESVDLLSWDMHFKPATKQSLALVTQDWAQAFLKRYLCLPCHEFAEAEFRRLYLVHR